MKEIQIYCNYGVLGAEKRNIYTYGSEHPHATCSDKMDVIVPDEWELYMTASESLAAKSPWGWTYEINEILSDLNGNPVFKALDDHGRNRTYYLYTAEQLAEKSEKEARKKEKARRKTEKKEK